MNSHSIKYISDENEPRGAKRPHNYKNSSRFHTGTRFHQATVPVRGRADIPPRWRAQLDIPAKRDGGGELISGSSINSPFFFQGMGKILAQFARKHRDE